MVGSGLALTLAAALAATGRSDRSAAGDLRLTLEPGIAFVRASRNDRTLGVLGGVALGVSLGPQLWVEARFDRRHFLAYEPHFAASTAAIDLHYAIDILDVRPYIEGGLAYVALAYLDPEDAARRPALEAGWVPALGVGFDSAVNDWLWFGAGVRYLPILGSDLRGEPAYLMVSLRLSGVWRW